jgi:hypothetical protein
MMRACTLVLFTGEAVDCALRELNMGKNSFDLGFVGNEAVE